MRCKERLCGCINTYVFSVIKSGSTSQVKIILKFSSYCLPYFQWRAATQAIKRHKFVLCHSLDVEAEEKTVSDSFVSPRSDRRRNNCHEFLRQTQRFSLDMYLFLNF